MTLSSLEERTAATAVATCHGSLVGDTIQVGVEYGRTIKGCIRRLSSTTPSGALQWQQANYLARMSGLKRFRVGCYPWSSHLARYGAANDKAL
ncbi:hypothetical protein Tco_0697571 [Tanacetum coccineum]